MHLHILKPFANAEKMAFSANNIELPINTSRKATSDRFGILIYVEHEMKSTLE